MQCDESPTTRLLLPLGIQGRVRNELSIDHTQRTPKAWGASIDDAVGLAAIESGYALRLTPTVVVVWKDAHDLPLVVGPHDHESTTHRGKKSASSVPSVAFHAT